MENMNATREEAAPKPADASAQADPAAQPAVPEGPAESGKQPKPRKKRRRLVRVMLLVLTGLLGVLLVIGEWKSIQNLLNVYGVVPLENSLTSEDGWLYAKRAWTDGLTLLGLRASSPYAGESRLALPAEIDGQPVTTVNWDFSERLPHPRWIRQLVVPSSITVVNYHAFLRLANLETFEGGEKITYMSFAGTFNRASPFFRENVRKNSLIMGDGLLVHAMFDELDAPDADVRSGTVTVPDGVKAIALYALDSANGVESHTSTVTDIRLPQGVHLMSFSLDFFNGKTLTIPDGAYLENGVLGMEWPDQLTDIWIGTNVQVEESAFLGNLGYASETFHGTLHLADGATLTSLMRFISGDSEISYTLDCQRGAVPEDQIPSGVRVVYRD